MNNNSGSVDQSQDGGNHKYRKNYSNEIQSLFIDIAKRIDENSLDALKKFIPIDEIIYEINDTEPILLIQYVKQITFYLSKVKMELEEKVLRVPEDEDQNNYESLIQKLEAEVRQHIRIEQQQRLHIENLQQKLEEIMQRNQEVENILDAKDQEINSLNQRVRNAESEFFTKIDSQRDSTSRGQKSQEASNKNLAKIQKLNQTNYINNIHVSQIQPRIVPNMSNESSFPTTSHQHQNSLSGQTGITVDKINELIQNDRSKQTSQQKNTNKSVNSNSIQQIPLQLKALFSKVYNDQEQNQTQSRSHQSKTNISKQQSSKNRQQNETKSYETTYKDEQQIHPRMNDSNEQAGNKRISSRHGIKEGQSNSRTKISGNQNNLKSSQIVRYDVTRNLESQFIETDRIREELFKQFGQAQQHNAYISHRDNTNSIENDQKKKEQIFQKIQRFDKKENAKSELSKSSSFDGTSSKMVKLYRKEIKATTQAYTTQQKAFQNLIAYPKKKTPQ